MELEGTEYSPRGFAFWNILDEGKIPVSHYEQKKDKKVTKNNENITNDTVDNDDNEVDDDDNNDNNDPIQPLWLSTRLNEILNIRNGN